MKWTPMLFGVLSLLACNGPAFEPKAHRWKCPPGSEWKLVYTSEICVLTPIPVAVPDAGR